MFLNIIRYSVLLMLITGSQISQAGLPSSNDSSLFPNSLSDVKETGIDLGGSTGAKLVKSKTGTFVKKEGGGINPAKHIVGEYHANIAYRALGANVPEVKLYSKSSLKPISGKTPIPTNPVMLASFIKDTKSLGVYLKSCGESQKKEILKEIRKDFIVDVLLANWDVVGMYMDNILVTKEGIPFRIDNGSCFEFTAMGLKYKPFTKKALEIDTMRDPAYPAGKIFGGISNDEIKRQIDALDQKFDSLLFAVPHKYHDVLKGRMQYLRAYKRNL